MRAASTLFATRGFAQVSVADIAREVGIGASALYRHFPNKLALLQVVVDRSIGGVEAIGATPNLDAALTLGATAAATDRYAAVLWQRESRELDDDARANLRRRLVAATGQLAHHISAARTSLADSDATLLAWAVIATFGSTGLHRASLPRTEFADRLRSVGAAVCGVELGVNTSPRLPRPVVEPLSTRESLLWQAVSLFSERGYAAVSTIDIGRAAGTSGPNLYKHFPSKPDVLAAIATRAGEYRRQAVVEVLASTDEPRERLDRLLASHIDFAIEHSALMGVLTTELHQLPTELGRSARQAQRDYLKLWAQSLADARPDLEPAHIRIIVPAALAVADDAARTEPIARRGDLADRLSEICGSILDVG